MRALTDLGALLAIAQVAEESTEFPFPRVASTPASGRHRCCWRFGPTSSTWTRPSRVRRGPPGGDRRHVRRRGRFADARWGPSATRPRPRRSTADATGSWRCGLPSRRWSRPGTQRPISIPKSTAALLPLLEVALVVLLGAPEGRGRLDRGDDRVAVALLGSLDRACGRSRPARPSARRSPSGTGSRRPGPGG